MLKFVSFLSILQCQAGFCMCSLTVCKGSLSLPLRTDTVRCVCQWGMWNIGGVCGPVLGIPSGSWAGILMNSTAQLRSALESPECCSFSCSPLPNHAVHFGLLDGTRKMWVSLAASVHLEKLGSHSVLSLSPGEKFQSEQSTVTKPWHLRGGTTWVQWSCSCTVSNAVYLDCFFSSSVLEFLHWIPGFS